ncbi:uncharacterized protein LOC133814541 [Humulus lupulus]|uniref:uncharacterized protein LOC133814541 n=1 Tax=Humulus lupulus TaxID=3486 RepID=UPI002B400CA0|nr:uncharacterized protein LOC133814541 [Humulus lupulus]
MRFGKKGRLSPRYIGLLQVLGRIGKAASRLALLPTFSRVHDVFHVSTLRKYVNDPTHVLSYNELSIYPHLSYEEKPVAILDRKDKAFGNKTIPMVKVQWCNHDIQEVTWKVEAEMRERYFPYMRSRREVDSPILINLEIEKECKRNRKIRGLKVPLLLQ